MTILWAIIVGGIAGAIAKLLMPGRDPGGFIVTVLLGMAGAVVAGWIGSAAGLYRATDTGPGIIAAILGAMMILFIYRLVVGRQRRTV